MENNRFSMIMLAFVLFAGLANAGTEVVYDYSIKDKADPATQGWELKQADETGGKSPYIASYDTALVWPDATTPKGWRILDASTKKNYSYYLKDISALKERYEGWTLTWTFSMDASAWGENGTSNSQGYYLPPNQSRQSSNGVIIDTSGYRYMISVAADADGNLAIHDGVATHVLTSEGENAGYDKVYTISAVFDGIDTFLKYGDKKILLNRLATVKVDRIGFGDFSGLPQNSVVYQKVVFEVGAGEK